MKILVTGGAGFIGKALVERVAEHASVVIIDSLDPQVHPSGKFPSGLVARARCVHADLTNIPAYASELRDIDVVVHLAAQTGTGQSMYDLSRYATHNLGGTASLLEALADTDNPPMRIVLGSSRSVYGEGVVQSGGELRKATRRLQDLKRGKWELMDEDGSVVSALPMRYGQPTDPNSVYGLTKLWQEQLLVKVCDSRATDYAILRFQNVYGPGQALDNPYTGVVGYMTRRISAGEEIELFEDGMMTRDFIYIDDAVRVLEAAIFHPIPIRATFDVGSGKRTKLHDLAHILARIADRQPARIRISGRFRAGDIRDAVADCSAVDEAFGVMDQTTLEAGLSKYYSWFQSQPVTKSDLHERAINEMQARNLFFSTDKFVQTESPHES